MATLVALETRWRMTHTFNPSSREDIKCEERAHNTQSHSEIPGGSIVISDCDRGNSQRLTDFCFLDLQVEPQFLTLEFLLIVFHWIMHLEQLKNH